MVAAGPEPPQLSEDAMASLMASTSSSAPVKAGRRQARAPYGVARPPAEEEEGIVVVQEDSYADAGLAAPVAAVAAAAGPSL